LEEQTSRIELQKRYYTSKISGNPNWENASIFAERATGLNLKERPEFHKMIRKCRKGEIDLILTKSISRFGRNTLEGRIEGTGKSSYLKLSSCNRDQEVFLTGLPITREGLECSA